MMSPQQNSHYFSLPEKPVKLSTPPIKQLRTLIMALNPMQLPSEYQERFIAIQTIIIGFIENYKDLTKGTLTDKSNAVEFSRQYLDHLKRLPENSLNTEDFNKLLFNLFFLIIFMHNREKIPDNEEGLKLIERFLENLQSFITKHIDSLRTSHDSTSELGWRAITDFVTLNNIGKTLYEENKKKRQDALNNAQLLPPKDFVDILSRPPGEMLQKYWQQLTSIKSIENFATQLLDMLPELKNLTLNEQKDIYKKNLYIISAVLSFNNPAITYESLDNKIGNLEIEEKINPEIAGNVFPTMIEELIKLKTNKKDRSKFTKNIANIVSKSAANKQDLESAHQINTIKALILYRYSELLPALKNNDLLLTETTAERETKMQQNIKSSFLTDSTLQTSAQKYLETVFRIFIERYAQIIGINSINAGNPEYKPQTKEQRVFKQLVADSDLRQSFNELCHKFTTDPTFQEQFHDFEDLIQQPKYLSKQIEILENKKTYYENEFDLMPTKRQRNFKQPNDYVPQTSQLVPVPNIPQLLPSSSEEEPEEEKKDTIPELLSQPTLRQSRLTSIRSNLRSLSINSKRDPNPIISYENTSNDHRQRSLSKTYRTRTRTPSVHQEPNPEYIPADLHPLFHVGKIHIRGIEEMTICIPKSHHILNREIREQIVQNIQREGHRLANQISNHGYIIEVGNQQVVYLAKIKTSNGQEILFVPETILSRKDYHSSQPGYFDKVDELQNEAERQWKLIEHKYPALLQVMQGKTEIMSHFPAIQPSSSIRGHRQLPTLLSDSTNETEQLPEKFRSHSTLPQHQLISQEREHYMNLNRVRSPGGTTWRTKSPERKRSYIRDFNGNWVLEEVTSQSTKPL